MVSFEASDVDGAIAGTRNHLIVTSDVQKFGREDVRCMPEVNQGINIRTSVLRTRFRISDGNLSPKDLQIFLYNLMHQKREKVAFRN